jgi:hypothetical protein
MSFLFGVNGRKKKKAGLSICALEFLGLLLYEGVFPLLNSTDSHSDSDESGLGRWPGSKSEHLDSARPDRCYTHTSSGEESLSWMRFK